VQAPWKEGTSSTTWTPPPYNGPESGPSLRAFAACKGSLVDLWQCLFPDSLLDNIAVNTNKYAFEDFVVPLAARSPDGEEQKKPNWKHVTKEEAMKIKDAKHRRDQDAQNAWVVTSALFVLFLEFCCILEQWVILGA
jgi:hypothetical protein